jgi:hypothetical protein
MVKNKSSFLAKTGKISLFVFRTFETIVFLSVIGLAIFIWQKPQYLHKLIKTGDNNLSSINSAKIDEISNKLETLTLITKSDAEKSDLLQQKFEHFDKAKVNSEEIIYLNNQISSLNEQINSVRNSTKKLSQTSNSGALLLTSAMLIRDNVLRGIDCKNESEGMKILAQNIDNLTQDIDFVTSHCNLNFVSNKTLVANFDTIYKKIENSMKPEEAQNWKQRLSAKLGEYVQISNHNQQPDNSYNPLQQLQPIKSLVDNGDLLKAAQQLSAPEYQNIMTDNDIMNWVNQVKNQADFHKSLSNIINASLLIMKVEDAQNTAE